MNLITNSFAKYELTEAEYKSSVMLTNLQKVGIQNLISDVAEEKINLTYDPLNPVQFAQQEADLTGKLTILRHILDLSQAAELSALEDLRNPE